MGQVLAGDTDDQVIAAFRQKAELLGHSLKPELRQALTAAARLTQTERVDLARRIRAMTPAGVSQSDTSDLIRHDRDTR